MLLTHAHIDHSGYLPRLVSDGFTGPVFATGGTADLLKVLLPDSAKLQEEEYRKYIRKLTGSDPSIRLRDVREAAKSGLTMAQMLEEMEKAPTSNSSGE